MRRDFAGLVRSLFAGCVLLACVAAPSVAEESGSSPCEPPESVDRPPVIKTDLINDVDVRKQPPAITVESNADKPATPAAADTAPRTPHDEVLDDILRIRDAEQDSPESKLDREEFSSALRRLIDEHRKAAQKIQIPLPLDERTDIDKKSAFDRWIGRPTPSRAADQSRWGELPQLFPQTKPGYATNPWISERVLPPPTTVPPPAVAPAPTVDALRRSARHFDTLAADHEDAGQYDQADAVRATAEMLRHEARRLSPAPNSNSPRY